MNEQMMTSPKKSKKKMWIAIAGAIVAVVAITIGIILAIVLSKPTINLNDYVSVSFSSYDGYGTARVELDYKKMEEEFEKELSDSCQNLQQVLFYYGSVSKYICNKCVNVKLSSNEGLSNGDVVTLKWDTDKEKLEDVFGCNFEFSDKKYTVSGLLEVVKVDAFKDIDVIFEGISGEGQATVVNNAKNSPMEKMSYRIDSNYSLSNGDVITVSLNNYTSINDVKYYMEQYGAVPMSDSKTYTVENLPEYVTDVNQISDEYISLCKDYAEEYIKDEIIETNNKKEGMNITVNSTDYSGFYLLTATDRLYYGDRNKLFLLYKVNLTIDIPEFGINDTREFYSTVYIDNITVMDNGEIVGEPSNLTAVSNVCYETYKQSLFSKSYTFVGHGFNDIEGFCNDVMSWYGEMNYTHWDKLLK